MSNALRLRRLTNDQKILMNVNNKSQYISIEPIDGSPPYKYLLIYQVPGYVNEEGLTRDTHHVEMFFPGGYPINEAPMFKFLDELWHPNVFVNGNVCLGFTHQSWTFAYDIDQLVYDIGNMIRFSRDSYNLDSPARGTLSENGWQGWIRTHRIPLSDIDFNVADAPTVKVLPKKEVNINIKKKTSVKVTVLKK